MQKLLNNKYVNIISYSKISQEFVKEISVGHIGFKEYIEAAIGYSIFSNRSRGFY